MKVCHRCRVPWAESGQPGFNNTCAGCGMSLHSCANCKWFVTSSRSVRCLKPNTPAVMDAVAANRCTQFEFLSIDQAVAARVGGGNQTPPGAFPSARAQWDKLFGD